MKLNRRDFVRTASMGGISLGLAGSMGPAYGTRATDGKKVGIIGLDTSHSIAFTKALNSPEAGDSFGGYKIVTAYPRGSYDIKSSYERIPGYTEEVKKLGVEISDSIAALLGKVDVVLLETNDGRLHLEQALQVMKAGKRMFIDKPVAASLPDTIAIFEAAKKYNVPVFTASSLRFEQVTQEIAGGRIGKVLGADTFSPATIEKTHPDLYWYGIHGVESLFTLMGTGCKNVSRIYTSDTDVVTGVWKDNRIGTFRGTRSGVYDIGGIAFGEKSNLVLGKEAGYNPLLVRIIEFFKTGEVPVKPEETIEIFAFMTAADESREKGGIPVDVEKVMQNGIQQAKKLTY
jgi:Oxidoreductase family, NAD-binding Rossmann fold